MPRPACLVLVLLVVAGCGKKQEQPETLAPIAPETAPSATLTAKEPVVIFVSKEQMAVIRSLPADIACFTPGHDPIKTLNGLSDKEFAAWSTSPDIPQKLMAAFGRPNTIVGLHIMGTGDFSFNKNLKLRLFVTHEPFANDMLGGGGVRIDFREEEERAATPKVNTSPETQGNRSDLAKGTFIASFKAACSKRDGEGLWKLVYMGDKYPPKVKSSWWGEQKAEYASKAVGNVRIVNDDAKSIPDYEKGIDFPLPIVAHLKIDVPLDSFMGMSATGSQTLSKPLGFKDDAYFLMLSKKAMQTDQVSTSMPLAPAPTEHKSVEAQSEPSRQEPNKSYRMWSDSTGKFKIEAKFIEFKNGKVSLEKEDGRAIAIPIDKLSEDDQAFVRGLNDSKATSSKKDGSKGSSYFVVRKEINKYIGTEVAWIGQKMTSQVSSKVGSNVETHTYIYVAMDSQGKFFADNPFSFTYTGEWDTKDTEASKAKSRTPEGDVIRLVVGKVVGSKEFRDISGNVSQIPELDVVTIDVPGK